MLSTKDLNIFIETIKDNSSYDFSDYSEKSFARRIDKIMKDYGLNFTQLIRNIKSNSNFIEQIVKDITVNTTELFRDTEVWQAVKYRLLPKLKNNEQINIWHAGCSTGQEIYSLKILLNELGILEKTNIYASDINEDVIEKSNIGIYPLSFNIEYLENFDQVVRKNPYNFDQYLDIPYSKYFKIDKENDSIIMNNFLKKNITYKKHDLVTKTNIFDIQFDIIFCRNVLIYFNTKLQRELFYTFNGCLHRKGFLVLGASESIVNEKEIGYVRHGNFYIKK